MNQPQPDLQRGYPTELPVVSGELTASLLPADADFPQTNRTGRALLACIVLALVVRGLVWVLFPADATLDRDGYLALASNLVQFQQYASAPNAPPTAFRPPLLPFCLAGLQSIGLPNVFAALLVLQFLTTLLLVWATWSLARALRLTWVGATLAALAVTLDPLLVRYSVQPMTECLCTALTVTLLWLAVRTWQRGSESFTATSGSSSQRWHVAGWYTSTGVVAGLCVLCRPAMLPLAVWVTVLPLSLCLTRWKFRQCVPLFLCGAFGLMVVLTPWIVRNWLVLGSPVVGTTHGGYTLLLANNTEFDAQVLRQPWGTAWPGPSLLAWQAGLETDLRRDLGEHPTELDRDRWYGRRAWDIIRHDPGTFLERVVYRQGRLWSPWPIGEAAAVAPGRMSQLAGGFYLIEFAAALIGLLCALRNWSRGELAIVGGLLASLVLIHAIYWTDTRMRAPLQPALAVLAAAGITTWRRPAR